MKILVVGKGSYIGSNIQAFLEKKNHKVKEFDILNNDLLEEDLRGIDVVIHVAAIVHRKDIHDYSIYYKVNVELPVSVAQKAKRNGVKQFIFLSSMAIYGEEKQLKGNIIDEQTLCKPISHYAKSKLEAEHKLQGLEDQNFKIAIVRPANVYGKGCRGNYISGFCKVVKKLPVIPFAYANTKQGLIYIDNLCQLVYLIIEKRGQGVFPAQDNPPVSSLELMNELAKALGLKRKKSKIFGWLFYIFRCKPVKKLFGGVAYDEKYAQTILGEYQIVSFEEAIQKTIKGE